MTPEEKRDLEELKAWKRQIEEELPKEDRARIRTHVQKWQIWLSSAAIVLTIFGIGTPAGVSVLFSWINKQAAVQKEDVQKAAKTAIDEAKEEIQKSLTSEKLRQDVASKLNEQLRGELNREFKEMFSTHAIGMLGGVKMYVEALNLRATQTPTVMVNPKILREILYSLSDLEQAYGDLLASGRATPATRAALLYTISGLFDRARGFEDRGREWFMEACRADVTFPEAHLLLGQAYLQDTVYQGNGKWSNEHGRRTASEYFQVAKKLFGARIDAPARLAQSYVAMVEVSLKKKGQVAKQAEQVIKEHLEVQQSLGKSDPRFFLLQGGVHFSAYQDMPHAEEERRAAATSFLKAFSCDPEFIRALNNYLWIRTHDWNDRITAPLVLDTKTGGQEENQSNAQQNEALFRDQIRVLEQHPLAQEDPALLHTLAEVYAALCVKNHSPERVEEYAERACRLAEKALTTARLVNSPHLDLIRKSHETVQKLCNEALRK